MKPIMLLSALCCFCLPVRAQELTPSLTVGYLRQIPTADYKGFLDKNYTIRMNVPGRNGWFADATLKWTKLRRFYQGVQLSVGYFSYDFGYSINNSQTGITDEYSFPIRMIRIHPSIVASATFARHWKSHFSIGPGVWFALNDNSELYFSFNAEAGIGYKSVLLKLGIDLGIDKARTRDATLPNPANPYFPINYYDGYRSKMIMVGLCISPVKFKLPRKEQ